MAESIPPTPPSIAIPQPILNGILNYLAGRPYHEVAGLIRAIEAQIQQQLTPSPVPPAE